MDPRRVRCVQSPHEVGGSPRNKPPPGDPGGGFSFRPAARGPQTNGCVRNCSASRISARGRFMRAVPLRVRRRPGRGAPARARSSPASASSDRRCPNRYPQAPAPCSPTRPPCRSAAAKAFRARSRDAPAQPQPRHFDRSAKREVEKPRAHRRKVSPLRRAPHGSGRNDEGRGAGLQPVRFGLNRSPHAPLDTALRAYSG